MTLGIHECWTEKEIEDTLKALKKVERAYLKLPEGDKKEAQ